MDTLDDLLIKRRRGALAAAEERRLDGALRASREYELALLAQNAFDRDGASRAGDADVLRELIDAVERRLPPAPRAPRAWRAPLRVAAAVLVAGAAAAAVALGRPAPLQPAAPALPSVAVRPAPLAPAPATLPLPEPPTAREPPGPSRAAASAPETPGAPAPHETRAPALSPPRAAAQRRSARPPAARSVAPPSAPLPRADAAAPVPPAPGDAESAQSLFRRANRLRQSDWPAAASLYGELILRYPASNEAGVSEVALGKWSLAQGRSGDAVEWFRAHQRRGPGALTAEALFGEARALESIGSVGAARAPWQRLLETYPDSPYANVARQRLGLP